MINSTKIMGSMNTKAAQHVADMLDEGKRPSLALAAFGIDPADVGFDGAQVEDVNDPTNTVIDFKNGVRLYRDPVNLGGKWWVEAYERPRV